MVKSSDGGVTWSKPVAMAPLVDVIPLANTAFRVNSFPAADIDPTTGALYAAWSSQTSDATGGLCPARTNTGCHAATFYSKSVDGGTTWSTPALILPALDALNQTAIGYPVTQPDDSTLNAPPPRRADTLWPSVAVSPSGRVYLSAYAADVVSPLPTCAARPPAPVAPLQCDTLGNYIHNAKLDYV